MKRTHAITLFVLLGLSALLASVRPTTPRFTYQQVSVCGAFPNEKISDIQKRIGEPEGIEQTPTCNYVFFKTPAGYLTVSGKLLAHYVEGPSLELSGTPVAKRGDSRLQILQILGPPQNTSTYTPSATTADSYCDEKLFLYYENGRLTRVAAKSY